MKIYLTVILLSLNILYAQNPKELITYEGEYSVRINDPIFKDEFLFESDWMNIYVYDFSNTNEPILISTIDSVKCNDFKISDNLLICTTSEKDLLIFDISNCYNIRKSYQIKSIFNNNPEKIEIIGNNIFVLETTSNIGWPSPYGYDLVILKLNEQNEPNFVKRFPLSYETTSNYNPRFLSISNYLYFSDLDLGTFVYHIINDEIEELENPFPNFYRYSFSNDQYYLEDKNHIYIYNLNDEGKFNLMDSLYNLDQFSRLGYFTVKNDIIFQAFGWPNNLTLKVSRFNQHTKSVEHKETYIDSSILPSVSNIICNNEIILIAALVEQKTFVFSYDQSKITNIKIEPIGTKSFRLLQNYPNPFNPSTTINYSIPLNGTVSLILYDILGNEVFKIVDKDQSAGNYKVDFDATNISSGIYFYRLQCGNFSKTKKLTIIK